MTAPFTVDGRSYDVLVPAGGLRRSFQVLDGENAGRLLSGDMERDIIGTFYNYTLEIRPKPGAPDDYDALYEVLSAPENFHDITVPYGQGTLSFRAYVAAGEDTLRRLTGPRGYWDGLSVQFIAKSPQRRR